VLSLAVCAPPLLLDGCVGDVASRRVHRCPAPHAPPHDCLFRFSRRFCCCGLYRRQVALPARLLSSSAALPSYVISAPATEATLLPSGLRVASQVSAIVLPLSPGRGRATAAAARLPPQHTPAAVLALCSYLAARVLASPCPGCARVCARRACLLRLSSTLRVVFGGAQSDQGETATVGVYIGAGSRNEALGKSGTAHLVEHLAFKVRSASCRVLRRPALSSGCCGPRLPCTAALPLLLFLLLLLLLLPTRSRVTVAPWGTAAVQGTAKVADPCAAFAKLGGSVSAVTDRSRTFYRATVLKKDVAKAVELLADIVQNSRLSDADLEKEKAVVLQEIAASKQNLSAVRLQLHVRRRADRGRHSRCRSSAVFLLVGCGCGFSRVTSQLVFDNLHDTAYQGTGLAHSPLGCARSLAAITANDLRAYVNSNYTAPRTVVVGAGAVEHKAVRRCGVCRHGLLRALPSSALLCSALLCVWQLSNSTRLYFSLRVGPCLPTLTFVLGSRFGVGHLDAGVPMSPVSSSRALHPALCPLAGALCHHAVVAACVAQLVDLSSSLFAGLPKTSGVEDEAIFLGSEIRVRVRATCGMAPCSAACVWWARSTIAPVLQRCVHRLGLRARVCMQEDTIPTAHMAIAFETAGYKDPRMATLRVMQALLGSWDKSQGPNLSSPLSRVRHRRRLCLCSAAVRRGARLPLTLVAAHRVARVRLGCRNWQRTLACPA
jgi:predicted Zn-dependent peptidase